MIFIDEKQLYSLLTPTEVIEAIEKSFHIMDSEQVEVPQRVHINRDGNVILLMPCLTDERFAVKIVSVYPGNTKLGRPALYGIVALNDGKTGQPLAIIDGASLTAVRTAAVSAVGAKYTVPEEIETLGIIGAGAQGFHHAWFIGIEKQIKKLMVFDVVEEKAASLASDIKKKLPHIQTVIAKDSRQLVKGSQLIVTATTSDTPVVPDELGLIMNKHFIGVGSYKPTMRELPNTLYRELEQVWIDSDHALEEAGDLIQPMNNGCMKINQVIPISKLITGQVELIPKKPSLFKTAGMALFDLVVADLLYEKAISNIT